MSGKALGRALTRARLEIGKIAIAGRLMEPPFEFNLHLEDVNGYYLPFGRRNILIPNQEWIRESSFPHLAAIDAVWAKTRHAEHLFSELGCKVCYLGWMGTDRRAGTAGVSKALIGLHIAGSSLWKGTETVLDVWSENPGWPLLRVLRRTHGYEGAVLPWRSRAPAPNIEIITDRVDEEMLVRMQNESAIHVCPSEAEGFGHILLESMSVGAVTITTDAPPMNEMITADTGLLVAVERSESMSLGRRYFVSRADLARSIDAALRMSEVERAALGHASRARFEAINIGFRERLRECLGSA
jgi:hypothetical protein